MYSFNMKDGNVTVLGQKTEFVGELEFSDNLVITGTFEGRIQSSGNLRIDKTAQCKVSQIAADSIFVAGAVTGDLKAASKLEIALAAIFSKDDIIVIDPEREYAPLIKNLGGENIKLSSISVFNGVNRDLVTVKEIENR